ncbi:transcription factor IIIb subunit, putative [Eimeria tenella]|uniref:B-related factor 1 n=1 Tax=Eimeria tenella TaxID=5802 RepID=U6KJ21_EIMTE|nr:transcription factor IIIb subunit, putative [Eimeria tenella]CDJ38025.1 transcription factor IIIb subunit, putative [Eimeria tenella]|eukprot:XP_013228863.1 transcription factor IIIb subunit, putative [Eimeria tenella]
MAGTKSCRFCGSEELERSENKGELTCCRCGAVLEESGIVEGLQFTESAGGGMSMVGRFVPAGGTGRSFAFGGGETREQALQRGLSNIQSVADSSTAERRQQQQQQQHSPQRCMPTPPSPTTAARPPRRPPPLPPPPAAAAAAAAAAAERLRLSGSQVAAAHRLYLMASQRNFSVGRKGLLVAGACLYAICRRERSPHLLVDFADALQVSVRSLGQMFLKLLRVLHVQVPHIDPSLFIERFALQLNLGSKTQTVAHTAVRLVQAMKRDWIATGRRPMGLCGAALLIAARYHDIQIDAEDVAVAVRISCPTLSKRLYEFRRTAVAQLPAAALGETDLLQLPALPLPPCRLTKKRQQPQQQQQQQLLQDGKKTLSLEDGPVAAAADSAAAADPSAAAAAEPAVAGEPAAEAASGDHGGPSAAAAAAANTGSGAPGAPQAAAAAEREGQKEAAGDEQQRVCSSSDALCNEQPSSGDILSVAGWIVETISASPAAAADAAAGAAAPAAGDAAAATTETPAAESTDGRPAAGHAEADAAAAAAAEPDGEEALQAAEGGDPLADLLRSVRARADELLLPTETQGLPAAASSGEGRAGASGPAAAAAAEAAAAAGEAAEGLEEEDPAESEDGLEDMLLNEHEREAKALIWDDLTRDIMPEVHRRLRQRKQKEREQQQNQNKRRRPQAQRNAALAAAATAAESVRLSLERKGKGLAQRIDEEALEALFAARKVIEP